MKSKQAYLIFSTLTFYDINIMTKLFLFFSKRSQQQRTANLRKSKRIEGRRFLTIGYDGEVRSPLRDRKNTPRGGGTGNATVQRSKSAQTPSNKTKHLNKKNNITEKGLIIKTCNIRWHQFGHLAPRYN